MYSRRIIKKRKAILHVLSINIWNIHIYKYWQELEEDKLVGGRWEEQKLQKKKEHSFKFQFFITCGGINFFFSFRVCKLYITGQWSVQIGWW